MSGSSRHRRGANACRHRDVGFADWRFLMISRRSFVTGSTGLFVPIALGHAAVTAKRKKKKKTVTRTFSNTQTIDIRSSETRSSQIAVSGLKKGKLLDVNVILNGYTHPQPDDVD